MVLKNMINSEKTNEERRRALRFGCKIPAKVVKLDGRQNFIERVTVLDFSRNGFRLSVNFASPNPGARIELKLFLHKKQYHTKVIGEIVWRKYVDNQLEIGVRTLHIENRAMGDILSWVLARWIEKQNKKKELHYDVYYNGTNDTTQPSTH
jgi:hypothetical protein